jgi:hypothetical protein
VTLIYNLYTKKGILVTDKDVATQQLVTDVKPGDIVVVVELIAHSFDMGSVCKVVNYNERHRWYDLTVEDDGLVQSLYPRQFRKITKLDKALK